MLAGVAAAVVAAAIWNRVRRRNLKGMDLMKARNKLMNSPGSVRRGRDFKPRPSDVFIVTYPKCGTTWVTQICHSLRSRGSMDFDEITEVIPWDVLALDCGQNLDHDQVASPRLFKSHEPWEEIAQGGKYIYVARNPSDAFFSFYKFLPAYMGISEGDITIDEFATSIFSGASNSGQIWNHFLGFWQQRHRSDVLWVTFEDLKKDLRGEIRRIAEFMEVKLDQDLEDITYNNSTYKFMSAHASQFDDHFVFNSVKDQMGMPKDACFTVGKVRKGGGTTGSGKSLPAHLREKFADKWNTIITPTTGLSDYADMQRELRQMR